MSDRLSCTLTKPTVLIGRMLGISIRPFRAKLGDIFVGGAQNFPCHVRALVGGEVAALFRAGVGCICEQVFAQQLTAYLHVVQVVAQGSRQNVIHLLSATSYVIEGVPTPADRPIALEGRLIHKIDLTAVVQSPTGRHADHRSTICSSIVANIGAVQAQSRAVVDAAALCGTIIVQSQAIACERGGPKAILAFDVCDRATVSGFIERERAVVHVHVRVVPLSSLTRRRPILLGCAPQNSAS